MLIRMAGRAQLGVSLPGEESCKLIGDGKRGQLCLLRFPLESQLGVDVSQRGESIFADADGTGIETGYMSYLNMKAELALVGSLKHGTEYRFKQFCTQLRICQRMAQI